VFGHRRSINEEQGTHRSSGARAGPILWRHQITPWLVPVKRDEQAKKAQEKTPEDLGEEIQERYQDDAVLLQY